MRTLCIYIDRTREMRQTDQLFVCLANLVRGKAISRAYVCENAQMPGGVRTHSTRGMAESWALFKGVGAVTAKEQLV